MHRRLALTLALSTAMAAGSAPASAQGKDRITIGYVVSKTGPNAGGAATTTIPNYELWVKEVNDGGGIMVESLGGRLPVEVVAYDDRSNSEEAVRAVERLITQDQVDFILPPWGTALNLAVGPQLHKHGYPHLAVTAVTERAPELAKRWPRSFWLLGQGSQAANALVDALVALRGAGKIGDEVDIASVADAFGIDLATAGRAALGRAGFNLVYDKSYPVGTQDLGQIISEIKGLGADVFIGFSYPPDTIGLTEQARLAGFNPKLFYVGVGTAFPLYKERFGDNVDGVMGIGGWNAGSPKIQDYLRRHKAVIGREPDRWASAVTYASLEMLQQAIERVASLDREAVAKELATGSFDTVIGTVRLKDNIAPDTWWVGQWQDGDFVGLAPARLDGARAPLFPKPAWKPAP